MIPRPWESNYGTLDRDKLSHLCLLALYICGAPGWGGFVFTTAVQNTVKLGYF